MITCFERVATAHPAILDAEREIDLRSTWRRIADHWWLPVAGAVIGAVIGVLVSVGGGDLYEARTLLYLGQPFTPSGGGQIQSLQTNPKTVSEIIRSEAAIKRAARVSGLTPAQLPPGSSECGVSTWPGSSSTICSPTPGWRCCAAWPRRRPSSSNRREGMARRC